MGRPRKLHHATHDGYILYNGSDAYDDRWVKLAFAIVTQASNDWKDLIADDITEGETRWYNYGGHVSFLEIRKFFLSNWADLLLTPSSYTGVEILEYLESLKENADARLH